MVIHSGRVETQKAPDPYEAVFIGKPAAICLDPDTRAVYDSEQCAWGDPTCVMRA